MTVHCRALASAERARPIAGSATFTTEPSTNVRLDASTEVARTSWGCAAGAALPTQRAEVASQYACAEVLTRHCTRRKLALRLPMAENLSFSTGGPPMERRIDTNIGIDAEPDTWVHSACILCSNGRGLHIAVKDGRIVGVRGAVDHPVNFGHLGPKGEHGWVANDSRRRGTRPMIRRNKDEPLLPVSWQEAMQYFVERFRAAWRQGHQNLACYNSGQLTLEELYTLGKLWRGGLRSANIDGNTRRAPACSQPGCAATLWRNPSRRCRAAADRHRRPGGAHLAERQVARRCDGCRHRTARRGVHTVSLRARFAGRQPTHLVCERSGESAAASSPAAVRRLSFGQPEPWLLARLEELDGASIVPFAARELEGTVNYTVSSP